MDVINHPCLFASSLSLPRSPWPPSIAERSACVTIYLQHKLRTAGPLRAHATSRALERAEGTRQKKSERDVKHAGNAPLLSTATKRRRRTQSTNSNRGVPPVAVLLVPPRRSAATRRVHTPGKRCFTCTCLRSLQPDAATLSYVRWARPRRP